METLDFAFKWGVSRLKKHRCPDADAVRETEELLLTACRMSRTAFLSRPEKKITPRQMAEFRRLLVRRLGHEPLAFLLGTADFLGRHFLVSRDTLIPRPATEIIVETAIAAARRMPDAGIIDVGTGSGVIAITLAAELPGRKIMATDNSARALAVARKNARRHGVSARIRFQRGNLAEPALKSRRPPLVIANLPYIPTAEWRELPPDIRKFEPREALDGGRDGLDPYRALLRQLADARISATVIAEILPKQRRALTAFCQRLFKRREFRTIANLAGVTIGLEIRLTY